MLLLTLVTLAAGPVPFTAVKPRTLCLATKPKDRHLPHAAWLGDRFALTWYEKHGAALEQTVGLLEEVGEPVGSSVHAVSAVDGAGSVMGRLAFNGTQLGVAWEDDAGGKRSTAFRVLDKSGAPKGEVVKVSAEHLPHGDQPALAWNPESAAWGVLFTGLTTSPQGTTHHQYVSILRGEPKAAIRVDDDESSMISHNAALLPRGRCFVTVYASAKVTLAEVCEGGAVKRTVVEEKAKAQQATLALGKDSVLVAWTTASTEGAGDDVRLVLVDSSGKPGRPFTLGGAGLAQSPSLHFDGVHFWVTWSERVKDTEQVWLAQLRANGTLVDKPVQLPGGWAGPVWSTFAVSAKKLNVLVSHPNDAECAASFIAAAAR